MPPQHDEIIITKLDAIGEKLDRLDKKVLATARRGCWIGWARLSLSSQSLSGPLP
jgi:hypothetical protein